MGGQRNDGPKPQHQRSSVDDLVTVMLYRGPCSKSLAKNRCSCERDWKDSFSPSLSGWFFRFISK